MLEGQTSEEISVTAAWLRLIDFVRLELPHGELKVRIVNCEPTELIEAKRKVRFDKPQTLPTDWKI